MKITMLGTAAIGYPLAFCNCSNCNLARQHGGKSLRKRASALINDDMIIDLGPDVQSAMMMYNKNMSSVKYLLQTHIHTDHYDEGLLISRIPYMAMKNHPSLEIIAHPLCLNIMSERVAKYEKADLISLEGQMILNVHTNPVLPGEKITLDNYDIKAIHTNHDAKHGSLLYVITYSGKNLFYATDTNALSDTSLDQLKEYHLDVIIMDHTLGNMDHSFAHLNEKLFIEQLEKMKKLNIINDHTLIYGTHISHDGLSYHEAIEARAISHGYHIAYDGMEIII